MYHFIFYFIYRAKLKADGPALTRYSANLIVMIFLVIHFGMLYSVIRFSCCYFWQISIARESAHATQANNLPYLLFGIATFFLSYKYFNEKKINAILNRYQGVEKFYTAGNILKFILLFILPLLISIFLVNKSVLYCQN